jgi:anti-sigma B factor antagonist
MSEAPPMTTFDFALTQERAENGVAIISVAGEVDIFTAPELKTALSATIDGGAREIVIDLSETRFMDSTALGVLIGAVKKLRPVNGHLAIVNTEPSTTKTFAITGLDRIFTIVKTRPEAIAALEDNK